VKYINYSWKVTLTCRSSPQKVEVLAAMKVLAAIRKVSTKVCIQFSTGRCRECAEARAVETAFLSVRHRPAVDCRQRAAGSRVTTGDQTTPCQCRRLSACQAPQMPTSVTTQT